MLGRASRRPGRRRPAFRPQRLRRGDFRWGQGDQGVQYGQKFRLVQTMQKARRVQARLLLRTDIQQARSGAGQSRLPCGMAGVSEGATEIGRRETSRQKETGGRTERAGTAAAGAPGNGHSPSCSARAFHIEHCPAFPERAGTGRKNSAVGQAASAGTNGTAQAVQALARQA